ncbi:integrase core domain-containing protein [Streptomyces sp. NPDC056682]|uniref:integrase core domain-containing protein n=1 Tax=Streptomyces sp. NPDC056682 TaxID=3345909 RepID=UPI0036A6A31F
MEVGHAEVNGGRLGCTVAHGFQLLRGGGRGGLDHGDLAEPTLVLGLLEAVDLHQTRGDSVRDYTSEQERRAALADCLNHYNHERPHSALGGRPPISRTSDSDYRIVFDQPPESLDTAP